MRIFDHGELTTYCYLVERGKPAAMIPIKIGQAASAAQFIKEKFNLLVHTEELDDNWQTLWIYKQPYILEVIKSLPRVPETVFDHWVLGKLFGYDEAAILDYLDSSQF